MKTKILLFNLLLLIVSCKAQTTYSEETLKKQSEKITNFQQQKRISKTTKITVGDIVSKLDVPIISFGFMPSWNNPNIDFIRLKFYTDKEYDYKRDNNIKLYNIYIYIKNPINSDQMLTFWKKNQGKWTQEVNDYFKDMEVESVNID